MEGKTYIKVPLTLPPVTIGIAIGLQPAGKGISIIQVMQIVPVPAPGAGALLAIGCIAACKRRRQSRTP